ncbi:MAG: 4-alpha-glucanotransferase [Acidobacteria bacterium]|nr:4-alpha-glucanotransferase [Acidobacteriota bacterium]
MPPHIERFQPADSYPAALARAARLWGIEPDYWDVFGTHHVTAAEVQKAILTSLGVPTGSTDELNAAVEERLWRDWASLLPSTIVTGAGGEVALSLPEELRNARGRLQIDWESGGTYSREVAFADLPEAAQAELRTRRFVRLLLSLPADPPLGYHRLRLAACGSGGILTTAEARLVLCPERAWSPPLLADGGRTAGIAVSLYGLRSRRNWGCGDFTDLRSLIDWFASEVAGSFIALNPLHAIPNRQPFNTSPYLPTCTFYRNALYLDVENIPDFAASRWATRLLAGSRVQCRLQSLRTAEHVEYEQVYELKLAFLRLAFRELQREERRGTARARQFRDYIAAEGDLLEQYATFCALDEWIHARHPEVWIWADWPEQFRDPASPEVEQFRREHCRSILFHKYLQWQVEVQLGEAQRHARERGLSLGLYHDLALATDRWGGDLWAHRRFYVSGCRVGSPPDSFAPKGQDWGFPPPHAPRHHEDGYRLFVQAIRKNMRHGGALRIDHVMRFFRLYWIPDSMDATEGAYVQDSPEHLLRILALESVRNRVLLIGEDLGTVAPGVRETLDRFGVRGYRLLYFEKNEAGDFKRPAEYPRQALVSASTHDLPALAGFWTSRDIEARRSAGLLPDDRSYRQQLADRRQEKQKLLDLLFRLNLLPHHLPRSADSYGELTGDLHNAVVGFLALTPSELMVLNQEDLFKEPDQQNLPGSTHQYPNWRHKMRFSIEELGTSNEARDFTAMFRNWLVKSDRAVWREVRPTP